MEKDILIKRIQKGGYTQEQLLQWVNNMRSPVNKRAPIKNRKGDVYMHPAFRHPYILLEHNKEEDVWLCCLLTSDGECSEVLEKCRSRFFEDSYVTKTLITVSQPIGTWFNTYDNSRHLNTIIKKLQNTFTFK